MLLTEFTELTLIVIALRVSYALFTVLLIVWFSFDKLNWFYYEKNDSGESVVAFNGHPLCMCLAWIVLMSEGIVAWRYYERNCGIPHSVAKTIHSSLQYSAVVIMTIGLAITFNNHSEKNLDHMASGHAWLGMLVVFAMVAQILLATHTFLFTKYERFKMQVLVWHRYGGLFIYLGGIATICMGFEEKQAGIACSSNYCHEKIFASMLAVLAVLVAMLTMAVFIHEDQGITTAELSEKINLVTNSGGGPARVLGGGWAGSTFGGGAIYDPGDP
ncbi:hypothetical protein CYMTET_4804 [Cymbomonas tetramitiformis]|uniref:Cytochrome b561 domain-containing protein n=1 Tax=Cymbomonas tetramitiformis TaxID=36881 RepID=A0AAE0LJR0_9CHLO|nr:hypothetical protein CYMTET_4804 [Cymbomonas tetramitiformis]